MRTRVKGLTPEVDTGANTKVLLHHTMVSAIFHIKIKCLFSSAESWSTCTTTTISTMYVKYPVFSWESESNRIQLRQTSSGTTGLVAYLNRGEAVTFRHRGFALPRSIHSVAPHVVALSHVRGPLSACSWRGQKARQSVFLSEMKTDKFIKVYIGIRLGKQHTGVLPTACVALGVGPQTRA